ncbi:hypothetical protein [Streptomyces sp. NPDC057557]|uniref:hypothetical protein n=1 Tax=Streptomyces sp. NPDC057557 TaxID=3346167 RepID=UPI0036A5E3F5
MVRLRRALQGGERKPTRTKAELRRAVSPAWRLGAIGRACSWGRLFPGASDSLGAAGDMEGARWLLELLTEPPL